MEAEEGLVHKNNIVAFKRMPLGTVIRMYVEDTNPPKIKRFIIVGYYGEDTITVYFNTNNNIIVNYSTELQALQVPFEATSENREYLDSDCYCDCARLINRNTSTLHTICRDDESLVIGELNKDDLDTIMNTLKHSDLLKGVHKKRYGFYDYFTE